MKVNLLLFVLMCFSITSNAVETNELFSFKKQNTLNEYQQYIGKSFKIRRAISEFETWEKSGLKFKEELCNNVYTITSITMKDVRLEDKPNKEIRIEAELNNSKRGKIKFKTYQIACSYGSERTLAGSYIGLYYPNIDNTPIVFVDALQDFKRKIENDIIEDKKVKDTYSFVDVFIGESRTTKGMPFSDVFVTIKNNRTNELQKHPYNSVNTDAFESAFEGSYSATLSKVEKPEDANNPYGDIKTIESDSIAKYSYVDSIMDILIFTTQEQFNFCLKNVSEHSLRVIWNDAIFVGLDGIASKIMHVGTKYSQKEGDQPATTIIKNSKLDDIAVPTANVYYYEGIFLGSRRIGAGWKKKPMLPKDYKGSEIGEIRLMIPIQIKGILNEYTFVFNVKYQYKHPELLHTHNL